DAPGEGRGACAARSDQDALPADLLDLPGDVHRAARPRGVRALEDLQLVAMAHRAGALVLRREDDGRILCDRCVLADRLRRRIRGLIGHGELEQGEGIVLRPSWSVHTFFLRYPIDIVFVDADQVVLRVVPNLRPWKWATCRGARDVVELRAGEC